MSLKCELSSGQLHTDRDGQSPSLPLEAGNAITVNVWFLSTCVGVCVWEVRVCGEYVCVGSTYVGSTCVLVTGGVDLVTQRYPSNA